MTTRKKTTDPAKPAAKRTRKKARPEADGGLFTEDKQVEVTEPKIGLPIQELEVVVATTPSPTPVRAEPTASTIDDPISPPTPPATMPLRKEQSDASAQSWLLVTQTRVRNPGCW